jgi:hypothetical protein
MVYINLESFYKSVHRWYTQITEIYDTKFAVSNETIRTRSHDLLRTSHIKSIIFTISKKNPELAVQSFPKPRSIYVAAPHTTTPRALFFVSPFPQQLHFLKYCQRTALERDRRRSNEALDTYNISSTIEKKHKEWPSISQNCEWAIFDFVRYGSNARIRFRRRDVFEKRYNLFKYRRSSMTNHTDLTFMIILTSLNDIF